MKSKIEQCCGKQEADKFTASNNWFQRFKRRHKIVLRRRTNKKKDSLEGRQFKNLTRVSESHCKLPKEETTLPCTPSMEDGCQKTGII